MFEGLRVIRAISEGNLQRSETYLRWSIERMMCVLCAHVCIHPTEKGRVLEGRPGGREKLWQRQCCPNVFMCCDPVVTGYIACFSISSRETDVVVVASACVCFFIVFWTLVNQLWNKLFMSCVEQEAQSSTPRLRLVAWS